MAGLMGGLLIFVAALLFVAIVLAAVGFFIARALLLWLAERISRQVDRHLDRVAGITQQSGAAQVILERASGVGNRLRHFAQEKGYDTERAKSEFLRRLDSLARRMDSALTLPIIGGVGLNAVIGVVPLIGDAICAVIGLMIILNSLQYGLPQQLVKQMTVNVFTQFVLGIVPVVGDLAAVVYRANTRNVGLLQQHIDQERRRLRTDPRIAPHVGSVS